MKTLHDNNFPTPIPIDANRHAILMSYVEGFTFQRITDLEISIIEKSYHFLLDQIIRLAEHGLIHSDFNEYNIIIGDKDPYDVSIIDFPQMVSTDHKEAELFFYRDVNCIERLFRKKHNFTCERDAQIKFEDIKVIKRLDKEVKASGYWKFAGVKSKEVTAMEAVLERGNEEEEYIEEELEGQEEDNQEQSDQGEDEDAHAGMEEPDNHSEDVQSGENAESDVDQEDGLEAKGEKFEWKKEKVQKHGIANKVAYEKNDQKTIQEIADHKSSKTNTVAQNPDKKDLEKSSSESEEDGEDKEFQLTQEQLAEQQNYIKKALKKKFRTNKTFKSNKNKMKEIGRLNREVKY